jgi:hypothetical protein
MKKTTLTLIIVGILMLSGCRTQSGGTKFEVGKIDDNGFALINLETNGFHGAVGGDINAATEEFNRTIQRKHAQEHTEEMAQQKSALTKKLVNADTPTSDITVLMESTFGPSN